MDGSPDLRDGRIIVSTGLVEIVEPEYDMRRRLNTRGNMLK
jgi:hypothetical protein